MTKIKWYQVASSSSSPCQIYVESELDAIKAAELWVINKEVNKNDNL